MSESGQSRDESLTAAPAGRAEGGARAKGGAEGPPDREHPGPARATLDELPAEAPGASREVNLESILDIPVSLSMEVGRTRISIRHLLQLNQGSVVELDRLAGEPLDVLVNGTLVAHGEVVVVNEKFGIRLTDVVSAHERVHRLR
jgi:flagellar motor switch protein FliN/FliY